jgi:hypothetical protein
MAGGYLQETGFVVDKEQVSKPQELSPDSACGRAFAEVAKVEQPTEPAPDDSNL